ncbi:hypothetical protein F5887DRAFT_215656 [Amanita rubescens]|nr:hypothetical protein F5887DRAFT_215656 [Amanita rubescens]
MGVRLVQRIQFCWKQRQNSTWRCTLLEGKWARVISGENHVEETVTFGWNAFCALRTTFPIEVQVVNVNSNTGGDDPVVNIPLNLDRLRCCVIILRDLFRTPASRPVQLPLGLLVRFVVGILTCSSESQVEGHVDANVRALELSLVPDIWKLGCQVLADLTACAGYHLTPHLPRLMSCLIIHLESKSKTSLRLAYLTAVQALLIHCHPLDSDILPNRLANYIQPLIASILSQVSGVSKSNDQVRKGKKRNRNFEGDEILKGAREALCQTPGDEQVLLKSLEVFTSLWQNPNLSIQTRSILARNVVAVYLALPRLPPALLSVDPFFHARLSKKVQAAVLDVGTGSSNVSGRSLGLIVAFSDCERDMQQHLDLLLHPRVPPLVRREPYVETLPYYHNEESREEPSDREDSRPAAPEYLPKPSSHPPKGTSDIVEEDQPPSQMPAITTPNSAAFRQPERDVFKPPPIVQDVPDTPIASIQSRVQIHVQPAPAPQIQPTNDDEEMPDIDMASDSEESDS